MFMIHQIFLFVHDWFKCITWPNSSPLKLEDNWGYHPSDIPRLSNLMSTMIILCLKYNSRWESILWLLQKGGIFVCPLSCTGKNKNQKKTFHATNSKLFINNSFTYCKILGKTQKPLSCAKLCLYICPSFKLPLFLWLHSQ